MIAMGGDAHLGISDKAVASAAKALFVEEEYGGEGRPDIDGKWLNFASVRDREQYRRMARAALEAAAPHMLADYLLTLAADTRARGGVGKEEEGGIEAWTYLEWKAEHIRTTK